VSISDILNMLVFSTSEDVSLSEVSSRYHLLLESFLFFVVHKTS
jgi:hypothetical protein